MTADFAMAAEALAKAQSQEGVVECAIREHARLVYRIAYSVLRNPADAEDAVQETFLRMLRYQNSAAKIGDQKAWLARIAWRVAVDRRNKLARLGARSEQPMDTLPSPASSADRALLEKERNEALDRLINALPDQLREPLVLAAIGEFSPREIADVLAISEAAVRSRIFRARQFLRDRMLGWIGNRP